jgi:hypothetical protein
VASFVAVQRTDHGVPHALSCRVLEVSETWFYKWWRDRQPTARQQRRVRIDEAVRAAFEASDGTYGSPRVLVELREGGERVPKKTVEASMARQGLFARPPKRRRRGLTWADRQAPPAPDLLQRDFTASKPTRSGVAISNRSTALKGRCFWPAARICSPGGWWASHCRTAIPMPTSPKRPSPWRWRCGAVMSPG